MAVHPLGFSKHSLPLPFGYRLRLHVWRAGARRSEDRHTHRHWFVSVPLWGRLAERRYRQVQGQRFRRLVAQHPCTVHEARPDGYGDLIAHRRRTRIPLVPYFCPRTAVHNVYPLTKRALSLVLTGRPVGEYTTIWRSLDAEMKEIN
jgi:hypothetical protein